MAARLAKGITLGETDYRLGALERLHDARILLEHDQFAGSIYLAGRAVEGMLRALLCRGDPLIRRGKKPLESAHDLRELLKLVRDLGLLRSIPADEQFEARVHKVARLWFNNMRFISSQSVTRWWVSVGAVRRNVTLKRAASEYVDTCLAIVRRCEARCGRLARQGFKRF